MLVLPDNLWPWALAWAALLGAALGSFLNVVIARVPAGLSVVRPRSRCPRCLSEIAWYDNLPVVSWLLLRARCRTCGAPISARYPLVELLGGGAAFAAMARHGLSGAAAAELAFAALLLALAFIDLDTWLLPHALTWPLIALGLVSAALGVGEAPSLRQAAYGAGLGFAAFAGLSWAGEKLFRREALGFGDVWLLAGLGAFLGVKALLPVVLLASVQGTVVGLVLAGMGRLPKGEEGGEAGTGTSTATPTEAATTTTTSIATDTSTATEAGTETATAAEAPPEEDDWVPPRNAVPFGPFLVAGALEWLYLGEILARSVPTLELFR